MVSEISLKPQSWTVVLQFYLKQQLVTVVSKIFLNHVPFQFSVVSIVILTVVSEISLKTVTDCGFTIFFRTTITNYGFTNIFPLQFSIFSIMIFKLF